MNSPERVSFHQPSRLKDAHFLKRLLATGGLKIFAAQRQAAPHLVREVGYDLAGMLEAAQQSTSPAFVIRSAPVSRMGSLMEEEADLRSYQRHLCSCQAVVEALRLRGIITVAEETRALSYLKLNEMRWPEEPRICANATLYLDNLSTTYLRTIGVLDKLKTAGFAAFVTKSLDDHDNQLITYESFSEQQLSTIETIRSVLAKGLADGRIETIASPDDGDDDIQLKAQLNFLTTDKAVDAFVVDDRFVNRYPTMAHGSVQTRVITSLDLIGHLVSSGAISAGDALEHKTNLRRSGYAFVPVTEKELVHHLMNAPLIDGVLFESAELRAIRESVLKVRLSMMLQVPHELAWLQQFSISVLYAARTVWTSSANPKDAAARCEWLVPHFDTRGWASIAQEGAAALFARTSYAGILHALTFAPDIVLKFETDPYHRWVDERLLREIAETEPEIHSEIVAIAVALLSRNIEIAEEKRPMKTEDNYLKAAYVMAIVGGYPPTLRDELLSKQELIDQAAIKVDAVITLGADGLSFRRSELFPAVISAFDRTTCSVINTVAGEGWTVKFAEDARPPSVVLERDRQRLLVAEFALLTPDSEARVEALECVARQKQLGRAITNRWRALLSKRALNDHEMMDFRQDLQNTTIGEAEAIAESLQCGGLSLEVLLPRDPAYYQQLIGDPVGAGTLEAYLSDSLAPFLERLLSSGQVVELSLAWLVCVQPLVSQLIEAAWNGDADTLASAFTWLSQNGDPISNVGAIELGLRSVQASPQLAKPLSELIDAFLAAVPTDKPDPFVLLSALFVCIYGQMAMRRVIVDWPPFIRRAAALAHAAIVARQLRNVVGNGEDLILWLQRCSEPYFTLQCLIDMRAEPRWFPGLASPDQWRNELIGRVFVAAASVPDAVDVLGLRELLLGKGTKSVASRIGHAEAMLPGPLEGASPACLILSPELRAQIQDKLTADRIDTTSFTPLFNASLWWQLPEQLVESAVMAIERSDYQIFLREEVDLATCLLGLASVAAISRSHKLREAIQIVVRVSRKLGPGAISSEEAFRIGALACAAHEDAADWAKRVGQFMTELAFQDLTPTEAKNLQSSLTVMCHIAPPLWGTCGQATAALALAAGM